MAYKVEQWARPTCERRKHYTDQSSQRDVVPIDDDDRKWNEFWVDWRIVEMNIKKIIWVKIAYLTFKF